MNEVGNPVNNPLNRKITGMYIYVSDYFYYRNEHVFDLSKFPHVTFRNALKHVSKTLIKPAFLMLFPYLISFKVGIIIRCSSQ